MRHFILSCAALVALSACGVPTDPNTPPVALARDELAAVFSGKTIVLIPTQDSAGDVGAAIMRADGTARVTVGPDVEEMQWYTNGQSLCFNTPGVPRRAIDCRLVGWVQGNRFAVYDARLGNEKIADGLIR